MIAFPEDIAAPSEEASAPKVPSDNEELGDEIARLAAHLHVATYHLLVLIREFDERECWGWGFRSCAQWLSWRTGIGPGPAREKVRVARALASLPLISGAMARGELSFSKVRALTRVAKPENEADLLEVAQASTAAQIEKLVRTWRYVDRLHEADEEQRRHEARFLRLYPDYDGSYVLRARLDPEVGALLEKALEWAADALYRTEGQDAEVTAEQRRADAMALVAERAMASGGLEERQESGEENKEEWTEQQERIEDEHGTEEEKTTEEEKGMEKDTAIEEGKRTGGDGAEGDRTPAQGKHATQLGRADRFQVVVHVDAPLLEEGSQEGLAFLADRGLGVSAETSRRLACDASVVQMTHGADGQVLDVGRKRRTVPPAIRRALDHRDGGCRFPGCGSHYTDAHHITHWADGGETKLDNLLLVCRRHHRAVHEGGILVEMVDGRAGEGAGKGSGEAEIRFIRPDGREIPTVPEAPKLPKQAVSELIQTHRAQGIEPDAWTATPSWNGETFDYDLAISSLWPRSHQME